MFYFWPENLLTISDLQLPETTLKVENRSTFTVPKGDDRLQKRKKSITAKSLYHTFIAPLYSESKIRAKI